MNPDQYPSHSSNPKERNKSILAPQNLQRNPSRGSQTLSRDFLKDQACRVLVAAYKRAGGGESIDWSDLDFAAELAAAGLGVFLDSKAKN